MLYWCSLQAVNEVSVLMVVVELISRRWKKPALCQYIWFLWWLLGYHISTNEKCKIVGSASSTPAVIPFLQDVGKQEWGKRRLCEAEEEVKRWKVWPTEMAMSSLPRVEWCSPSSSPGCAGALCRPRNACGTLPFAGSRGVVWGTAICWRHGHPTQAVLSCFTFCSVLGETRVSPMGPVPHRHSHMGCRTQLPGEGLLLRSPSPHVTVPGLPMCQGVPWGPHSWAWCFSSSHYSKVDLKQIKINSRPLNFQVSAEARVAEAEPVLCAAHYTPLPPVLAVLLLLLPTHPAHGTRDAGSPQHPSLIPKGGKRASQRCLLHCPLAQVSLPRTGGDSSAGEGRCAGWDRWWCRLRTVAAALPGSLRDAEQQMQGRHWDWRLPLFWPWALSELGGLESHPAFGQIPSGFAHSFSFHEWMV